jgi:hypothetical protein
MTIAMYSRTTWRDVEQDFTVGQTDGEFTGTIERTGDRFLATTNRGEKLGEFRTIAAAERALERDASSRGVFEIDSFAEKDARVLRVSAIAAIAASISALTIMSAAVFL